MKHGVPEDQWARAKEQARSVLVEHAKRRAMTPYSTLVGQIDELELKAYDTRLFALLGEVSSEEADACRGMLSALVVHKTGDMQPGPGFFELAAELGLATADLEKAWIAEVKKVFRAWAAD